ncbi:hypothetical protein Q5P01_011765 [Channa striata]|uniref:Protein S100 n=1 Tax=Channa striata TaxID=64152 RepID=A0AA88MU02_CHASR|nr:hypothetical protein Q5P01_011765 [Channa striata]
MSCDKSAGKPLSDLQKAMKGINEVFEDYAGKEGDKTKLNKSELKKLLKSELNIDCTTNPNEVEQMMKDLDADSDGEVDFLEYVIFVVSVTTLCNEFFTKGQTPCKK